MSLDSMTRKDFFASIKKICPSVVLKYDKDSDEYQFVLKHNGKKFEYFTNDRKDLVMTLKSEMKQLGIAMGETASNKVSEETLNKFVDAVNDKYPNFNCKLYVDTNKKPNRLTVIIIGKHEGSKFVFQMFDSGEYVASINSKKLNTTSMPLQTAGAMMVVFNRVIDTINNSKETASIPELLMATGPLFSIGAITLIGLAFQDRKFANDLNIKALDEKIKFLLKSKNLDTNIKNDLISLQSSLETTIADGKIAAINKNILKSKQFKIILERLKPVLNDFEEHKNYIKALNQFSKASYKNLETN